MMRICWVWVDGLELWATGTAKLNKATDKDGAELAQRMDWATATGVDTDPADNDPDGVLADLDIISALKLQVKGSAALDVAGSLLAYTGDVELTMSTTTVTDDTVTVVDANVLSIEVLDAAVFAGTGAEFNDARTGIITTVAESQADPAPDLDADAVGFLADGVEFTMVLVNGAAVDSDINVIAPPPELHGDQSEVAIAVNPADPDNIIIAPIDDNPDDGVFGTPSQDSVWVSTNGGKTFEREIIPLPAGATGSHGDPTIVFSRDGSRVVYVHMVDKTDSTHNAADDADESHVMASAVSLDGGATWTATGVIGSLGLDEDGDGLTDDNDKEFVAVGPRYDDLGQDRFAVSWHRNGVIYASTSDDGIVWAPPQAIGNVTGGSGGTTPVQPSGTAIDAIPTFGPNGEIYVVWEDYGETGVSKVMFDVSLDGGVTWGVGGNDVTVYFIDTGEDAITDLLESDVDKLDALAGLLKSDPQLVATIEGHTDTQGGPVLNQNLSERRAQAVFDYLTDETGHDVDEAQLKQVWFGESQLAVLTGDEADEPDNRRVEVTLDRLVYTGSVNVSDDPVSGGDYVIPAQPDRGIWMGLSAAVDLTEGAHAGRIYVAFADQGDLDGDAATGHDDTDIFVIASDDGGLSWDALGDAPAAVGADQNLIRVNDDSGTASQFFAWLDVDQTTGNVAVSWYDARNDAADNDDVQYFAAFSTDGGASWSSNVQVSDGTSNGAAAGDFNLGDYTGLAFEDGIIHTTWSDNSNSTGDNTDAAGPVLSMDAYYDRISLNSTYLGIKVGLEDARLIGVEGIELYATGTVKLNRATAANGDALSPRMDWALATDDDHDDEYLLRRR
jgi:hypothetical protein